MRYRRSYYRSGRPHRRSYWLPNEPFITYRCDKCGKQNRGQEGRIPKQWQRIHELYDPQIRTGRKSIRIRGLYCEQCAKEWAKRLVPVKDGVVVSANVAKRLNKQAHEETLAEHGGLLGEDATNLLVVGLGLCLLGVFTAAFHMLGWVSLIVGFSLLAFVGLLELVYYPEKRRELKEQSEARVVKLAEARRDTIEERDAFYASAEWKTLRDEVVREQGRVCQSCRSTIALDGDVTVDHIKPRSLYPDLSLTKSNLQVLCRSCNSKKGARV